jgi:hypothetical protein
MFVEQTISVPKTEVQSWDDCYSQGETRQAQMIEEPRILAPMKPDWNSFHC